MSQRTHEARLALMRCPSTTVEKARAKVRQLESMGADVALIGQAEAILEEIVAIECAKLDAEDHRRATN